MLIVGGIEVKTMEWRKRFGNDKVIGNFLGESLVERRGRKLNSRYMIFFIFFNFNIVIRKNELFVSFSIGFFEVVIIECKVYVREMSYFFLRVFV